MEEDVLDSHKLVLDQIPKWHQALATLLSMTNEVDYDVDGTCPICFVVGLIVLFMFLFSH